MLSSHKEFSGCLRKDAGALRQKWLRFSQRGWVNQGRALLRSHSVFTYRISLTDSVAYCRPRAG